MLSNINCSDISFVVNMGAKLLKYLHFLIPLLLIVLVIFDLVKAFTTQIDDKTKRELGNKVIRRVIYALIIFMVPTILFFIFDRIKGLDNGDSQSDVSTTDWYQCFRDAYD